jgi:hypothetical protein
MMRWHGEQGEAGVDFFAHVMQRMRDGDTIGKVDGRVPHPRYIERVHLVQRSE